jgi:hypothetical protein
MSWLLRPTTVGAPRSGRAQRAAGSGCSVAATRFDRRPRRRGGPGCSSACRHSRRAPPSRVMLPWRACDVGEHSLGSSASVLGRALGVRPTVGRGLSTRTLHERRRTLRGLDCRDPRSSAHPVGRRLRDVPPPELPGYGDRASRDHLGRCADARMRERANARTRARRMVRARGHARRVFENATADHDSSRLLPNASSSALALETLAPRRQRTAQRERCETAGQRQPKNGAASAERRV